MIKKSIKKFALINLLYFQQAIIYSKVKISLNK
jgi:hypothetical protein